MPKYKELRKEVMTALGDDYCRKNYQYGGEFRQKIYGYKVREDDCPDTPPENFKEKISKLLWPDDNRENEFLVRYQDEFRYVLWKNKIKNLIYIGGAIDECMLHRSYGINELVGRDENRTKFTIYVLEDFTAAQPNFVAGIKDSVKKEILLKSLSYKLVKLSKSSTVVFNK
jgi:hypothetical protein